ncbi:protein CHUP1, chloroplastic-like isoform X1 [Malus sylvestris]|uniref:protein CHUP1, chloroplastic-like isoform X1 n=1 Tax=Malus sylvestris TaxID=3752 RepID=UPI0021AC8F2A|nr:protein CHUP1, chloroplastic-like isoform X1 [Malus sylvestris]
MIKVSFLAAATVAAFAVSHKNCNSTRKQLCTAIDPPEKDDSNFHQQEREGEMEDEEAGEIITRRERLKSHKSVKEIELLQNLVRELQQRNLRIERKLMELCVLKEEQSYMTQLQRNLDEKAMEIDMLNASIASLQAERKVLMEDVKQCGLVKKQLDAAKKMIAEMQRRMEYSGKNDVKGRLLVVGEQVSRFPKDEMCIRDELVEKKLKGVKNVELEVLKMKRRNKELELEKRELAVKLVCAQTRITTLSSMNESETIAKAEEEVSKLKHTNEGLSRQVEKLQKNRFDMVEQLVYQRWLYACLRFETLIHSSPSPDTSKHDLSPSSHTSSTSLSDEITETTTIGSSSSSQSNKIKKSGFMQSIKTWVGRRRRRRRRKEEEEDMDYSSALPSKRDLVRRFSTSMVPVKASMLRNGGESSTTSSSSPSSKAPSLSRVRRVSFSDSVKSTSRDHSTPKSADRTSGTMAMDSTQNYNNVHELEGEKHELEASPEVTISASPEFMKSDSNIADQVNNSTEISDTYALRCVVVAEENKVDTNVVGFIAALFFFLFILVVTRML